MDSTEILFWATVGLIAYTYAGYPLVLGLISYLYGVWGKQRTGAETDGADADLPHVAVIIAAHNEEIHVRGRILNLLAQDYPPGKLHIYIGSDGSTDRTNEYAAAAAVGATQVTVYPFSQRRGKVTVLNELVARSTQPILIFSDANTEFDGRAIRRLVRHFRAPQVGVVCGELVLTAHGNDKNDDHTYWRYESWLKSRESSVGGLLGANGGIYAMRREAFVPPPGDTIVDDFVIAMAAYRRGFRLLYDQEALAYEEVAPDLRGEFRRRVRIGIGNYQALRTLFHLLSPLRGMLFFTYLSHKVMRWFVPHLLLTALIASACLWADPLYRGVFLLQLAGYLWVAISYFLMRGISTPRIVRIPTYVVVLNAALLIGFGRFISGQYSAAWKRTDR